MGFGKFSVPSAAPDLEDFVKQAQLEPLRAALEDVVNDQPDFSAFARKDELSEGVTLMRFTNARSLDLRAGLTVTVPLEVLSDPEGRLRDNKLFFIEPTFVLVSVLMSNGTRSEATTLELQLFQSDEYADPSVIKHVLDLQTSDRQRQFNGLTGGVFIARQGTPRLSGQSVQMRLKSYEGRYLALSRRMQITVVAL